MRLTYSSAKRVTGKNIESYKSATQNVIKTQRWNRAKTARQNDLNLSHDVKKRRRYECDCVNRCLFRTGTSSHLPRYPTPLLATILIFVFENTILDVISFFRPSCDTSFRAKHWCQYRRIYRGCCVLTTAHINRNSRDRSKELRATRVRQRGGYCFRWPRATRKDEKRLL